jgi:hypothetical protein
MKMIQYSYNTNKPAAAAKMAASGSITSSWSAEDPVAVGLAVWVVVDELVTVLVGWGPASEVIDSKADVIEDK